MAGTPRDDAEPDEYTPAPEEDERDLEAPEADTAEQRLDLLSSREVPAEQRTLVEADPADAAEQARVVELDEEEDGGR